MLLDRHVMVLNPQRSVVLSCGFAIIMFAVYHHTVYSSEGREPILAEGIGKAQLESHPPPQIGHDPTLEETIRQLFAPIKQKNFMAPFTDPTGTVYSHNNSIWTEPLGKDLLIVDVDTRYPDQMFDGNKRLDWEHSNTDGENLVSEAVFNHYLYATIHNYSYQYYRPVSVPGHTKTWPKVHSMANLLRTHNPKFLVFLDADASIRHLNLPFEWLLNRWNVTHNTSFTMARDPLDADCNLCDSYGVAMVNTGFVVVQNLAYTRSIFKAWMKCTEDGVEGKYEKCEQWKEKWAHEQSVFSDYLRYDYNPDGDNIREIECGEANGFPGHPWYDPVHCDGKFIRHHTFVKQMTKETTSNAVTQAFIDIIKTNLSKLGKKLVISEEEEIKKNAQKHMNKEGENGKLDIHLEMKEQAKKNESRGEEGVKMEERIVHEPLRRTT